MGLSADRILFGIHSISPYRRTDRMPYGILKIIGSANLALNTDLEQLFGGASKYAWAAETKTVATEFSAKVKAYPGFLFTLFLGADVTDTAADANGTVTAVANVKGTSIIAATGLASVTVKAAAKLDLKFGKYVLKATDATHVDVYGYTDIDNKRGADISFQDDALKLTAAPLAIAQGAPVDVPNMGLTLTGGAGVIALVVGDTASFEVMPPSTKSTVITVGAAGTTMPDFGAILLAAKRATGEMFEIDALNCVGGGLPISLEEMAFSQPELKMTCLYDSGADAVFKMRHILPSSLG